MTRHLFVVASRHRALYDYLRERFADDRSVEILLDRRHAGRQETPPACAAPPHEERRRRSGVDAELKTRSHTVITLLEAS
jgi:hypothetical protein